MDSNELDALKSGEPMEHNSSLNDAAPTAIVDGTLSESLLEPSKPANASLSDSIGESVATMLATPTSQPNEMGDNAIVKMVSSPGSKSGSAPPSAPTTPAKVTTPVPASSPAPAAATPNSVTKSPLTTPTKVPEAPAPQESPEPAPPVTTPAKSPAAPPAEHTSPVVATPTSAPMDQTELKEETQPEPPVEEAIDDDEEPEPVTEEAPADLDKSGASEPAAEETPEATKEEPMDVKEEAEDEDKQSEGMDVAEVEQEKNPRDVIIEKISDVISGMEESLTTKDDDQLKDWVSKLQELRTYADANLDASLFVDESEKGKKGKRGGGKQAKRRSMKKEKNYEMIDFINFSLKDIKGPVLPVFAKWPNSGWFYPGVVKDMTLDSWKNSTNVTVMFYDGLEREMKSVHILPAELVPATSVLFDLDDEVDVTVVSTARDGDWVTFSLISSEQPENALDRGFDKLAIKGVSMKNIKTAIDAASDTPQENISGKRMRGKSSLFTEDYVSSSASRGKKRSKTSDEETPEATSSRSPSKRRQVNGSATKTTPRRKASKGK